MHRTHKAFLLVLSMAWNLPLVAARSALTAEDEATSRFMEDRMDRDRDNQRDDDRDDDMKEDDGDSSSASGHTGGTRNAGQGGRDQSKTGNRPGSGQNRPSQKRK
ncbi:MAG TPA: hypothetical protein VFT97_02255 [Candidatus Eisenbacteria bacterium]|nr:hypothetical protein [Candidatus Eisenbacteria bacterium]